MASGINGEGSWGKVTMKGTEYVSLRTEIDENRLPTCMVSRYFPNLPIEFGLKDLQRLKMGKD